MRKFPAPIHNLVAAFNMLPGVGPKTALRYVYTLLRLPKSEIEYFATAVLSLTSDITVCRVCKSYNESDVCDICSDAKRAKDVLCVVAEPRDIATIEATDAYRGRYHVLGGLLNPIEGVTPDVLNIRDLMERLKAEPEIREVILAFSPNIQGETTMLYLSKQIQELRRKATKLARGLPLGADLEYADEVTLGEALEGRRDI